MARLAQESLKKLAYNKGYLLERKATTKVIESTMNRKSGVIEAVTGHDFEVESSIKSAMAGKEVDHDK